MLGESAKKKADLKCIFRPHKAGDHGDEEGEDGDQHAGLAKPPEDTG